METYNMYKNREYLKTKGEIYITDPLDENLLHKDDMIIDPVLKLSVLPGEYHVDTRENEDYTVKELVITHENHTNRENIKYDETAYPISSNSGCMCVANASYLDSISNIEETMKDIKLYEDKSFAHTTVDEGLHAKKIRHLYWKSNDESLSEEERDVYFTLFAKNEIAFSRKHPEYKDFDWFFQAESGGIAKRVPHVVKHGYDAVFTPTRFKKGVYNMYIAKDCDGEIISIKIDYMSDYFYEDDTNYAYEEYKLGWLANNNFSVHKLMCMVEKYKKTHYDNIEVIMDEMFTEWEEYSDKRPYMSEIQFMKSDLPKDRTYRHITENGGTLLDTIKKVENFRMTKTDRRGYEALDEIYEKYIREVG